MEADKWGFRFHRNWLDLTGKFSERERDRVGLE